MTSGGGKNIFMEEHETADVEKGMDEEAVRTQSQPSTVDGTFLYKGAVIYIHLSA
jgi:hypothetical protein